MTPPFLQTYLLEERVVRLITSGAARRLLGAVLLDKSSHVRPSVSDVVCSVRQFVRCGEVFREASFSALTRTLLFFLFFSCCLADPW